MDSSYAIPRRIWRILYPPLIFIGIQFVILIIAGIAYAMYLAIGESAGIISYSDTWTIIEETINFLTGHSMLFLLFSDLACFAILFPVWRKTRARLESYKNNNSAVICILIVGFFAAFNIVQTVIFSLTDVIRYFPSYEEAAEMLVTDSFVVQLLAIGIVAPMIEEVIFRAILINRMKWMPVWTSVLVQSALFGIVHMNLFQGLYAFIAGILLGLVYVKFKSLPLVMAGHMAYNLASLLLSELESETSAGIAIALSFVVLPVCAILTIRHKKALRLTPGYDATLPPGYTPANIQLTYFPANPQPTYAPASSQPTYAPASPQPTYAPANPQKASQSLDPWSGYHPEDPWTNNNNAPRSR